jgi:hypothetical protein
VTDSLVAARSRVGQEVRSMHRYAFRSGEWARVTTAAMDVGGPIWHVEWPDGTTDWYAADDPDGQYEFRAVAE